MNQDKIKHKGIITSLHEKSAEVTIVSHSACSSCHARGACSVSNIQDKLVTVAGDFSCYNNGELVNVIMARQQGIVASFWAYIAPLVISVLALVVLLRFFPESVAGLLSLVAIALYYLVLYVGRKFFFSSFSFKIEKI